MNVLVVDDDALACKMLRFLLMEDGYTVWTAQTPDTAVSVVEREQIDLIILDIMLPRIDGFQLFQQLRHNGFDAPVIFLTAKADMSDKLSGLQMGADDYVVKPFEPAELTARVKAVLRRYQQARVAAQDVQLRAGGIVLDVGELRVRLPGHKTVYLTRSEMKVLQCLIANSNAIVSRSALAEVLWGYDGDGTGDQVSVYIRRLRKKIEPDPSRPKYIESIRTLGYRFRPPD